MGRITMDSAVFQSLDKRLTTIENFVKRIEASEECRNPLTNKRMLSSREVCELLRISKRTLQRWRDDRMIAYILTDGKCLYEYNEIKRLLNEGLVNAGVSIDDLLRQEGRLR